MSINSVAPMPMRVMWAKSPIVMTRGKCVDNKLPCGDIRHHARWQRPRHFLAVGVSRARAKSSVT